MRGGERVGGNAIPHTECAQRAIVVFAPLRQATEAMEMWKVRTRSEYDGRRDEYCEDCCDALILKKRHRANENARAFQNIQV